MIWLFQIYLRLRYGMWISVQSPTLLSPGPFRLFKKMGDREWSLESDSALALVRAAPTFIGAIKAQEDR